MRSARRAAGCLLGALGVFVLHAGCGSSHDERVRRRARVGRGRARRRRDAGRQPVLRRRRRAARAVVGRLPGRRRASRARARAARTPRTSAAGRAAPAGACASSTRASMPGNAVPHEQRLRPRAVLRAGARRHGRRHAGDEPGRRRRAGGGRRCTQSAPASAGRCLPLPPTCPGDAGVPADGGTCIESASTTRRRAAR